MPAAIVEAVQDVNRVLVVPPEALPPNRAMRAAVCYASARMGEEVSFRGLRDLGQFDFRSDESPEYYYLNRYLARRELVRFHEYLHAPEIRGAVGELIAAAPEAVAA